MYKKSLFLLIVFCFPLLGFAACVVHKNIPYRSSSEKEYSVDKNILDVYSPTHLKDKVPVLIFIHGGSWNSGNKNTYRFLGKGFASKGLVAVIINYRLTPEVNYAPMAGDCAAAVKWVYNHIHEYGGDSSQIYVSGHSAGGHLAALISNDPHYFTQLNMASPIKGCILIDPFGLDMYNYFPGSTYSKDVWFKQTFTTNPATWKKASPQYYISKNTVPQLVWIGGNTYPSIISQGKSYYQALADSGVDARFETLKRKKHIGMIFQFYRKSNPRYNTIIAFVKNGKP